MYRWQDINLYNRVEVARLLGVSTSRFATLIESGKFPLQPIILGNGYYWRKEEVKKILPELLKQPLKDKRGRKPKVRVA